MHDDIPALAQCTHGVLLPEVRDDEGVEKGVDRSEK
jgi:hypothetical protein